MFRISLRSFALVIFALLLGACSKSLKVVGAWDVGRDNIGKRERIAVVAMMPEALQRLTVEQEIVEVMRKSGRNALVSSDIPGLSGRVIRERAGRALRAASVDAVIVVFINNGGKDDQVRRDENAVYGWFAPQFSIAGTVDEDKSFYDRKSYLYVESTYFDVVEEQAKWSMITRSKSLEYSDTAHSAAKNIVSKMKSTGIL